MNLLPLLRTVFTLVVATFCVANATELSAWQMPTLNNPASVEDYQQGEFRGPKGSDSYQPVDIETYRDVSTTNQHPINDANDNLPTSDSQSSPDQVLSDLVSKGVESASSRDGTANTVKAAVIFGALSLAPAILLMTTCYIRIVVVLGLLRQAFGAQQLPPTQVLTALSLFVTILVMAPVWNQVKTNAIDPYTAEGSEMTWDEAWTAGVKPVRDFMSQQIERAGNREAIAIFYKYNQKNVSPGQRAATPNSYADVPLNVILPAFVLSELKVAFLLGFQVYLPFLVLDLVVSSVTVSMGMLMLPPTMVSFPLKLILFVMVDGWNLVVGMLLQSFGPFS